MNRKIATRIIIVFILIVFSFVIYSNLITKKPLEQEFNGIVSEIRRMYPSKIIIRFENQSRTFAMSTKLEEFKKSVSIGDSLSKSFNNKYIYIFKLENNQFVESKKFIFK